MINLFVLQFAMQLNWMNSVSGKLSPRIIAPWSGPGFGLGLALELGLGTIFLGGNFPKTNEFYIKETIYLKSINFFPLRFLYTENLNAKKKLFRNQALTSGESGSSQVISPFISSFNKIVMLFIPNLLNLVKLPMHPISTSKNWGFN